MAKAPELNQMMQEFAAAFQVDTSKIQDAFKTSAGYGEKLTRLALTAAEQSAELQSQFTRETLSKLGDVSKVKDAPTDYSKALSDFAQAQAGLVNEQMTAFAEIARKLQAETVELIMQAAREAQSEAAGAVKSAQAKAADMAKKATSK
jgi:hypothetical protein